VFEDLFCGKIPKNREALVYVVLKRIKEGIIVPQTSTREEAERIANQEYQELPEETPQTIITFYEDKDKGLYIKYFDIIGMLKEKVRQLGLSRKIPGIISALEGLDVYDAIDKTWKIYLRRPDNKYIKHSECKLVAQPITTYRGTLISAAECIEPPVKLSFTIVKRDTLIPEDLFLEILRECNRLGGLRKQFGRFKWTKIEVKERS